VIHLAKSEKLIVTLMRLMAIRSWILSLALTHWRINAAPGIGGCKRGAFSGFG